MRSVLGCPSCLCSPTTPYPARKRRAHAVALLFATRRSPISGRLRRLKLVPRGFSASVRRTWAYAIPVTRDTACNAISGKLRVPSSASEAAAPSSVSLPMLGESDARSHNPSCLGHRALPRERLPGARGVAFAHGQRRRAAFGGGQGGRSRQRRW